ncbi:hypothetical protein NDR87_14600 [Nocardia sp. CDC159]|uniref:Uncharacterized protein n=1 Tax=Nocardia pulmonis TaxID=2951408 RepID=A0A9X2E714_9NOCA|nr:MULTISPECIES: hypothetical protein [Nocardia]MCM6774348.1 hypothetical protein [Nocardia pulmonis]MCM6787586.1 hypothetical protein [Nocardia sp. CDC159]
MIRRILTSSIVILAMGAIALPMANAQPQFRPCSQVFRVPTSVEGWTNPALAVVFSPYGTDRIYCSAWHGFGWVYQLDPAGGQHELRPIESLSGQNNPILGKVYFYTG